MASKILLIDDDDLVAKSLRNLLSRKGYQVETASSAIEAITLVAVKDFDLVISDIRMPGDSGVVAVEKIKKIYAERHVSCGYIFISGHAEEDTPAHAIRLGVDKFLFKPFDNEKILAAITEELDLVQKEKELRAPTQIRPPQVSKATKTVVSLKRVVITGIGAISPSGVGREAYWKGLREGMNCVNAITLFDTSMYPSKFAAEIPNFDPSQFVDDPHEIKRMGRSAHLAVAASKLVPCQFNF